ncbi:MAG: FecR domain-containing protein [Balneolales bacterium]
MKQEYNLNDLLNSESFRGWVFGYATTKDCEYWDHWVSRDYENRLLALHAQKELSGFSIKFSSAPDTERSWNRLLKKTSRSRFIPPVMQRRQSSLIWAMRIAAGFLVILLIGFFVFEGTVLDEISKALAVEEVTTQDVTTEYGERKTVRLTDGSSIILNANSRLSYTVPKANPNRVEVNLEGEAYFSVAERSNPGDSPFQVTTSEGTVTVLGTQFVISTRNEQTEVMLEEGRVVINPEEGNNETVMNPGQFAEFDSINGLVRIREVNPDVYTSWTTHFLVFDQTPLLQVFDRLEHTFGVEIEVQDPGLYKRKISGSIENFGLEVIISGLSDILNAEIYIDGYLLNEVN